MCICILYIIILHCAVSCVLQVFLYKCSSIVSFRFDCLSFFYNLKLQQNVLKWQRHTKVYQEYNLVNVPFYQIDSRIPIWMMKYSMHSHTKHCQMNVAFCFMLFITNGQHNVEIWNHQQQQQWRNCYSGNMSTNC